MSTERLLDDDAAVAVATPRRAGSPAPLTLDLDGQVPPASSHSTYRGRPWGTVLALLALCAAAAGFPEPKLVPSGSDMAVSVAPAVEPWDGVADPLGTVRVVVRVRNTGPTDLEVSRPQVLDVGSPPMAARSEPALLQPGAAVRMLVDVLPDCRHVRTDRDGGLVVQLSVRGPGGSRPLRLLATGDDPPFGTLCPAQTRGIAITATGQRSRGEAGWVAVRLVNTGTQRAALARSLHAPDGLLTHPRLPLGLDPGEAVVVRLRLLPGACPASAQSLLQAHGRYGHAHVDGMDTAARWLTSGQPHQCPPLRSTARH